MKHTWPMIRAAARKIDVWLDQNLLPLLLLSCLVISRLPSFFEPYWYGDEGIYLTLGNGLRGGARLYSEIIDHKTPLIYYFAMVPSQFWFRVVMLIWLGLATLALWKFAQRIFSSRLAQVVAPLTFVALTSWPGLEGTIPNGELFVAGWILMGLAVLTKTPWITSLTEQTSSKSHAKKQPIVPWFLAAGALGSAGILTKVPGLFDVAAWFWLGWLVQVRTFLDTQSLRNWSHQLKTVFVQWFWLGLGVLLPLGLSVIYYWLRGSGAEYFAFGLLYNFRYAGHWQLGTTSPLLLFSFSMIGKTLIMTAALVSISLAVRWLSVKNQWVLGWLWLSLYASLLSNRPYPHYFMQLVPPLTLLAASIVDRFVTKPRKLKYDLGLLVSVATFCFAVYITIVTIGFSPYPTVAYYQRWWQAVTGKISWQEYKNQFDSLVADNTRASAMIWQEDPGPRLFIWGTNPMLYAASNTYPPGRFTVSFHIKDFDAYQETLDAVRRVNPEYIVVMNNETTQLPGLDQLLREEYQPNTTFEHYVLWQRLPQTLVAPKATWQ